MPPESDSTENLITKENIKAYTSEELQLLILKCINDEQTIEKLLADLGKIGDGPKCYVRKNFEDELLKFVKSNIKNKMTELVSQGKTDFIHEARDCLKLNSKFFLLWTWKLISNGISLSDERVLDWRGELQKFYYFLESRFVHFAPEEAVKSLIIEWFETGEMSLAIWKQWNAWFINGIYLSTLKNIEWAESSKQDTVKAKFIRALSKMPTDDFLEKQALKKVLNIYLEQPRIEMDFEEFVDENDKKNRKETSTVNVIGCTIFLSVIIKELESKMKEKSAKQVDIIAKNTCHIDVDLCGDVWMGTNLSIVTDKLTVWGKRTIDVSGKSPPNDGIRKGLDGGIGEDGNKGRDGLPGESSGNITIVTEEFSNSEFLTLKLNGGNGQDGEDGGKGGDGLNGVCVTQKELNGICVKYGSLYREKWETFTDFSPPGWEIIEEKISYVSTYIYKLFKDDHGRNLYYTYGADKGVWYSWYELVIWIKGTDGTLGGIGGLNGVGGEKGNVGECTLINSSETITWQVTNTFSKTGIHGNDGHMGKCGSSGTYGNHIAMIDRSAKGQNKFYYGEDEEKPKRLIVKWSNKNDAKRRINRYRYIVGDRPDCYGEFENSKVPDTVLVKDNRTQKSERSTEAQTTMKQSIVLSKVKQKAQEHRNKMDAAMNAATALMTKSKIQQKFNIDENVEEEESIEQEQEVVIIKEVNEEFLDTKRSKARKSRILPHEYFENLYKKDFKGLCTITQEIINYFLIEFDSELLKKISKIMIWKGVKFRELMENSMQKTIVAALEAKKPNGLSLYELDALHKNYADKRLLKSCITSIRSLVAYYAEYCQTKDISVDTEILNMGDKLEKIKFIKPSADQYWSSDIASTKVEKIVSNFFMDYRLNEIDLKSLFKIYKTFTSLEEKYSNLFTMFERQNITWAEDEDWKNFKLNLDENDSNIENIISTVIANKYWFESTFHNWYLIVHGESVMNKAKNQIFGGETEGPSIKEQVRNKIIKSELEARFGRVPNFSGKADFKTAKFLIRFYWQMKKLLSFNITLMKLNLLNQGEKSGKSWDIMKSHQRLDLETLITEVNSNNVEMESNDCQEQMIAKKFRSFAFRYLISQTLNLQIEIYGNEKYSTVKLLESWEEGEMLTLLYFDGKNYYNIENDTELRKLEAARECQSFRHYFDENHERLKLIKWDYRKTEDKTFFASYFPNAFEKTIIEWIDCYLTSTKNGSSFLKMLHERFEVDGNHLNVIDFQFIISTAIWLQNEYCVPSEFILNFATSLPQTKLVDNFIILRLESQWRKQLRNCTPIILSLMEDIKSNRLKILLATKLENIKMVENFDEDILKQLFFMLINTSTNNNELEKMSLDDWILTAKKQKHYKVNNLFKDSGNIGYYIIYLKQAEKYDAAERLEKMFTGKESYHIPEKLIAQVCSLICYNEVVFNDEYITALEKVLNHITKLTKRIVTSNHIFITDETSQNQLLKEAQKTDSYRIILSEQVRTIERIANLIVGVNDKNDLDKIKRLKDTGCIVSYLNDSNDKNMIILEKVNNCLQKLSKGRVSLRDTQKMAIMYAVGSEQNILSQVNTGEGKSYIVATIAIIRALHFKSVDIITSSPVLAQRDAAEMKSLYDAMNLSVDHNCHEDMEKRKQAYKAKIVYGEISRFQRDYLLHTFYRKNILGERERQTTCVIVDEVDNMLLDNGNNMLYLSHSVPGMNLLEPLFVQINRLIMIPTIKGNKEKAFETKTIEAAILSDLIGRISKTNLEAMANTEEALKTCFDTWTFLVEDGILDSEGYLIIENIAQLNEKEVQLRKKLEKRTTKLQTRKIITCLKIVLNRTREIIIPYYLIPFVRQHLTEYIENAKRALFMKPNESYVVDVDHTRQGSDITPKITIIDQNTGVDLSTSQWSEGLHQCIQIKHGCRINPISMKAVFVSNVNYLIGYKRINGLSGTLGSVEESNTLVNLYEADLIKIPTFKAKRLYEHVPVIAKTEETWLDKIFEEVADQVIASRSVLIICRSINEVLNIERGLLERYEKQIKPDQKIVECYKKENLTIYQREFDEFDFGETNKFLPGRLIIATNLAGRGTDIKLSEELKATGGLHVIVSFLPENSRIEDQAYGRAARCGDPGSGQIIAITQQTDSSGKPPTVFELKTFRDHAEIERLQSLTNYYNHHTKIEEECLMAFKEHCLEALGKMSNSRKKDNGVPTEEEIIYFALLDAWALWLDSKSSAIKQCAQDHDDKQKDEIIASVKDFLKAHSINEMEQALEWINCPQPLLALGLTKLDQKKHNEAKNIFDKIIKNFPEFAGEACYYKGVMRQWDVRTLKKIPEIGNENREFFKGIANSIGQMADNISHEILTLAKDVMPNGICQLDEEARIETEDLFLHSIRTFIHRSENRKDLHTIVSRLQHLVGPKAINSNGFKNQTDEIEAVNDCLITSAYDMIGHPINFTTFAPEAKTIEDRFKGQKLFLKFEREGYISPLMLNHQIFDDQCEILRINYMLSKTKIKRIFNELFNDPNKMEFYDRTVFPETEFIHKCKLPRREEFWGFLDTYGCFDQKQDFYVFDTVPTDGEIEELKQLKPINCPKSDTLRVQLSDFELAEKTLYKIDDIEKAFEKNKQKLKWLESMNFLVKDSSAVINLQNYENTVFMSNYDYFTTEELAEWLEISLNETSWIISKLLNNSTIRETCELLTKINSEELNLTEEQQKKYHPILKSEELQKIDDVSFDVIRIILMQNQDDALKIYKEMGDLNIIIPYEKFFYFQNIDDLECPFLPECIRNMVETFLFHKFAYTFAYNALSKSLQMAIENPTIKKPIMLAWKPYKMLSKDLIKYGFIHDHKLEIREKVYLEKNEIKEMKEIEKKMKSKLFTKSGTLLSTKKYFKDEQVAAESEVQLHAINSMKEVAKIGENNWWILWEVFKIAFIIFMLWYAPGIAMRTLELLINIESYFMSTLIVLGAIGTGRYFIQMARAKYSSQTGRESSEERYSQLLNFHSKNIKLRDKHKNEAKLTKIICNSITTKVTDAMTLPNIDYNKKFYEIAKEQKLGQRKFIRLAIKFLHQPHNWRIFGEGARNYLERIKPQTSVKYFDIFIKNNVEKQINIEKSMIDCEELNKSLKISMLDSDSKLFKTILDKIIEDIIVAIQESGEYGDDEKECELPEEFLDEEDIDMKLLIDLDVDKSSSSNKQIKIAGFTYSIKELEILYHDFNDNLMERIRNILTKEISNVITKPLMKAFRQYIENINNQGGQSESLINFLEEDKDEKQTYEENKKQITALEATPLIIHDLQKVVRRKYENEKWDDLFYMMVLHGHALTKPTIPKLIEALYLVIKESKPELDQLKIIVEENGEHSDFLSKTEATGNLNIITIMFSLTHGFYYICQADSKRIYKNKKSNDYVGACLFESIVNKNLELNEITKLGVDNFREKLLEKIWLEKSEEATIVEEIEQGFEPIEAVEVQEESEEEMPVFFNSNSSAFGNTTKASTISGPVIRRKDPKNNSQNSNTNNNNNNKFSGGSINKRSSSQNNRYNTAV